MPCITNNSIKHPSFVYTELNDQTILFLTIHFSLSTKFNGSKYWFESQTIQLNISHSLLHTYMIKQFYFKLFSSAKVKDKKSQVLLYIRNNSIKHRLFVYTQLNDDTVLFQAIPFSIITQLSSIWPIDRTLSGAASPGQSWPWCDGNEGVLRIPQSSIITKV